MAASVLLGLLVALPACGDDDDDTTASDAQGTTSSTTVSTTVAPSGEPLPPDDVATLRPLFADDLADLGLRLTRGALVDPDAGYGRPATNRTHLALYVEPTGTYTDEDYVDGIFTVTDLFAPEVFDRWPKLESFDICQEPHPGPGQDDSPPPVTVVNLTRAHADLVDWDDADTAALVAASLIADADPELVSVSPQLRQSRAWRQVASEARELANERE